jgi:hypothetical protein
MSLAFALAMGLNQIACGAGKDTVDSTPSAQTNEVSSEQAKSMKIKIKVGQEEMTAL